MLVTYTPQGKKSSFVNELALLTNVALVIPIKLYIKGQVVEKYNYNIKLKSAREDSIMMVTYPRLLGSKKISTEITLTEDTVILIQGKKRNIYKLTESSYDESQKIVFYYLPDGTSFQYFLETNELIFQKSQIRHLVYAECTKVQ